MVGAAKDCRVGPGSVSGVLPEGVCSLCVINQIGGSERVEMASRYEEGIESLVRMVDAMGARWIRGEKTKHLVSHHGWARKGCLSSRMTHRSNASTRVLRTAARLQAYALCDSGRSKCYHVARRC